MGHLMAKGTAHRIWSGGSHFTDTDRNQEQVTPAQLRRERQGSRVYFIRCGEHVKIGWTTQTVARRFVGMSLPPGAEIVAVIEGRGRDAEQDLHRRFRASRIHGEWFATTPELEALIQTFAY